MITELNLRNFKRFDRLSLPLKPLSVLMGMNGMGKSTVIQAMLLLRQSYDGRGLPEIQLNGEYVSLGNGRDILYEKAQDEEIEISVHEDERVLTVSCAYDAYSGSLDCYLLQQGGDMQSWSLFRDGFTYLSAYRINPRELYSIGDRKKVKVKNFKNDGEWAIQYLGEYGRNEIKNKHVLFEMNTETTLMEQVRRWLSVISPGIIPEIMLDNSERSARLAFSFAEDGERSQSFKNVNVGFGITYVLPVIVALLAAEPGDIVMLENPGAHIHPAGQRWLGLLMARAAAGGVQVITETHSDHVMNGIRLAVKQKVIDSAETEIAFFTSDKSEVYKHSLQLPAILPDGRIDKWPAGFLDEWDHALMDLL